MKEITLGAEGHASCTVTTENTASFMGSGSLDVFATPAMSALMEKAAVEAVRPFLEDDETTVGTEISISHSSASPLGMNITADAKVTEISGREITFLVSASDECGAIGQGRHKRFVVYGNRFMEKAMNKSGITSGKGE